MTDDDDFYNSSFDDGEQDSNSEGANNEDETNDILDDFDGGEIEFMFTGNKSGVKFCNKDKGNLKIDFQREYEKALNPPAPPTPPHCIVCCGIFVEPTDGIEGPFIKKDQCFPSLESVLLSHVRPQDFH